MIFVIVLAVVAAFAGVALEGRARARPLNEFDPDELRRYFDRTASVIHRRHP